MKLPVLTLFILIPLVSISQFYFRTTANLSTVSDAESGPQLTHPKSLWGASLGIGGIFKAKKLTLLTEMNFTQKGFKIHETPNGFGFTVDEKLRLRLSYLEFPILAKLNLDKKNNRIYLAAGPYLAFALGGKYEYSYYENNQGTITQISHNGFSFDSDLVGYAGEDYTVKKKADFGLQFGLGYSVRPKTILDLRYGIGLTKLSPDDPSEPKNRCFQIGLVFLGR
ncbi:MAG: PorT family protein [Flammeovirgaceae bacterium]|nr:MAG: PorT family protein [Flammeovirgaceae bacterium]